ncbi:MAG: glycosyltransferase [Desulfovibrio sp.]|uniref:glycosyltransferase family 2 protein n=1 Tax=Desulfovibrio sp. TaxID=885 RepID=UPI00258C19FF|nr:glycosyltransferase family 2 protein [Desulfovibrio sp.]MCD7985112.1 glycosyltransferase [Desulfovibrio sp.]
MPLKEAHPFFSIITVCLNEPNLERTCESVVTQTCQDFEWLVIDGGSDEKALCIFEKYKKRMDYFISEKDNGVYHAMNKGILQSKGKYCNFMNAGDSFYMPDVLQKVAEFLKYYPEIDVLYGNTYIGAPRNSVVCPGRHKDLYEYFYRYTVGHQSSFIRRNCFLNYGMYDTNLIIASDYKYFLMLYKNGCIFKYFDNILAYIDNHGLSSDMKNINLMTQERRQIISEFYTSHEIACFEQKRRDFYKKCIYQKLRK